MEPRGKRRLHAVTCGDWHKLEHHVVVGNRVHMAEAVNVVHQPFARARETDDGAAPVVMDDFQPDNALLDDRHKPRRYPNGSASADEPPLTRKLVDFGLPGR